MNEAGRQAIKQAIGNAEDNLFRYRLQQTANPDWISGNGGKIRDIILELEKEIAELKENLK